MVKKPAKTAEKKSLFKLTEENRKKLKIAAAITERDMQDIVNEALADWFFKYEKAHGVIKIK